MHVVYLQGEMAGCKEGRLVEAFLGSFFFRSNVYLRCGESRGKSTTFQKNVILKDNVLDRDIFLLWSITHKCGLSIPSGIFYKCKTTSV